MFMKQCRRRKSAIRKYTLCLPPSSFAAQLSRQQKEAQQEVLTGPSATPAASPSKVTPRGFLTPQATASAELPEKVGADADTQDSQQQQQQAPKQVLRLVIKADVQGSMEAVTGMVRELAGDRVDLKVRLT